MDQLEAAQPTYADDFVLWLEGQAKLLRTRKFDDLDVDNIVDELEAAVRADRRELAAHLNVVVYCLLSLQFRPLHKPHQWRSKLGEARFGMELLIDDSPSLAAEIAGLAACQYSESRRRAAWETRLSQSLFPRALPYSVAQLLDDEFDPSYPADQGP